MARSNAVAQVTGELFEDGWSKVRGSMQGLGAKRQQMVRAARGGRSAVFKAIRSGGTHTKGQLMNQLEYLTTKSSHIVDSRGVLDGKTRLSADEIKSVADRFTERWDKGFNPKMGHTTHLLMSFPVGTRGADVRDIASDVAERFFATEDRNFDYLIAVHEDRAHPHAHVVLNRRSQEGEFFYLGRDHHFNYDDFRTAMVEEAEKYGVSLEATRRLDRGVVTYTPRTREIYAAKEQGREPVGRVRIGRDLDRALAEIASNTKVYRSLAAEASAENREDISNALFRAGEMLARGGQLEQTGEVYMADQQSFDDLKSSFAERMERVEAMVASTPEAQRPQAQARLNQIYRGVEHMQPLGTRSHTLSEPPTEGGIYTEDNVNRDALDRLREPQMRAQIETALRGTGISSETLVSRIETTANNAALERQWLSDDLQKIAQTNGLNLERREDLEQASDRLDQIHVQLSQALERGEVLRGNDLIDTDATDDEVFAEVMREQAGAEDYRERIAEQLNAEAGVLRAETEGIAAREAEAVAEVEQGVRAEFDGSGYDYAKFEPLVIGRDRVAQGDNTVSANAELATAFTALAKERSDGSLSVEDQQRADAMLRDTANRYGEQMRDGLTREDTREFQAHEHEDFDGYSAQVERFEQERLREFNDAIRPYAVEGDREGGVSHQAHIEQASLDRMSSRIRDELMSADQSEDFDTRYDRVQAMSENGQIEAMARERIATEQADYLRDKPEILTSPDLIYSDQPYQEAIVDRDLYDRIETEARAAGADDAADVKVAVADDFKARYPDMPDHLARGLGQTYATAMSIRDSERVSEFADQRELTSTTHSPEIERVIAHERDDKINPTFADEAGGRAYREEIERELDDDQIAALKEGDADALEKVIDDRLERLYAAKAYLQSDEATANSEATREVISEIADEEYDAHRLKHVQNHSEKGQTHG
ncbi:Relaxase/mobilization nuclease domain protein (plasmid) [Phaeobacter inhibens]|uniref:Relaxase/mobilization nuclease domain protein n=1 Tax=Phaeobacter inhibens TaxID=221822 RepID=A0ABM6RL92_9RHOB|nr:MULTISPECIES: relaxase/mobilization nuclease domain-containing protein [Roseobacteraceae]AUQ56908.1 Relaxase/mobilization nuclease domain protein [Phaeobacter inhibens]AUQ68888.1 Relaxase/mobilization nuclease domain protein [Phaeobacter inhibens]AUQ80925.1 Relaxase/mobilization nuclease domain protein [Phaeobacter inhibens]AUQ97313.1 Relaxase/mobilization nuclease domain protein [Phaeobacter inhibens]AUR06169.1 Relaxase/mobilization nuclease domain protein [Phaeobacter inhibens]